MARADQIVPVDSEHSAIAQCLAAGARSDVRRLILTASGGPFRGWSAADLESVTAEQALAHPTWDMGPLVTINSATLMNKGLEVIEAHLLFDVEFSEISVVVHPQSIVHSMVEFVDGSTIAQVSPPDMRLPIALGLDWPHRVAGAAPACSWEQATSWDFFPLDEDAFPAVSLARRAGQAGGQDGKTFRGQLLTRKNKKSKKNVEIAVVTKCKYAKKIAKKLSIQIIEEPGNLGLSDAILHSAITAKARGFDKLCVIPADLAAPLASD